MSPRLVINSLYKDEVYINKPFNAPQTAHFIRIDKENEVIIENDVPKDSDARLLCKESNGNVSGYADGENNVFEEVVEPLVEDRGEKELNDLLLTSDDDNSSSSRIADIFSMDLSPTTHILMNIAIVVYLSFVSLNTKIINQHHNLAWFHHNLTVVSKFDVKLWCSGDRR